MSYYKKILTPFSLFILFFTGFTFTITKPAMTTHIEQGPAYDRLYPYYIEACAVSQLAPIGEEKGGRHGHAVLYLKGVCRDESAVYPKIKLCDEGSVNLADPDSGVGISVDKMFKSVNWIAVPGKKLFFHGDLKEGQVLNKAHQKATIQKALQLGLFKGVEFHEEFLKAKPAEMPAEEFVARESLSTDYALKFGRSVFCASLPVTRPMLEKAVSFLNDLNREYAEGRADYHWSGYSDNCAHTVHNALARAGVWQSKSVNQIKFRQFFHLAIPANEFVDLAFFTNQDSVLDHDKNIYRDKGMKETLLYESWLPVRHGALLRVIGVHPENELYDKQFTIFLLDRPFAKEKNRRIQTMLSGKRYIDIETNLRFFEKKYEWTLARVCNPGKSNANKSRQQFHYAYCDYLKAQLQDVKDKIEQFTSWKSK